jgi:hypothetical protein
MVDRPPARERLDKAPEISGARDECAEAMRRREKTLAEST